MRIFPYRRVRIVAYVTASLTVANLIVTIFATLFQCRPVAAAWDFTIPKQCYKAVYYLYTNAAVNVATDLLLCITPLPFIWKLQIVQSQKVLVCGLFFVGGLYVPPSSLSNPSSHELTAGSACVATIFRLTILDEIANPTDWTWQLVRPAVLTVAECTIGICCCSVPAIRPLQVKLIEAGNRFGFGWDSIRSLTPFCKTSQQVQSEASEATRQVREEHHAMGYRPPWLTTDGGVVETGLRSVSHIPRTTVAAIPRTRDVETDGI
jgi:hypothetical protein